MVRAHGRRAGISSVDSLETGTADITGSPNNNYPSSANLDHPYIGALKDGYIVAHGTNGNAWVTDPSNFTDNSAALQWVNDQIVAQSVQIGTIHLPPRDPSNSAWSIPSTVTIGSSSTRSKVNFIHHGGTAGNSGLITTSIDNGEPMFEFLGTASNSMRSPYIEMYAFGSNNNVVLAKLQHVNNFSLRGRYFSTSGIAIQIDGSSFGFDIDDINIGPKNVGGVGLKFTDEDNVDQPGNGNIGSGAIFEGDADRQLWSTVLCPGLNIQGHFEGATGTALIDLSTLDSAKVAPSKIQGGDQTVDGIIADDGDVVVGDIGEIANVDNGIQINPSGTLDRIMVSENITYNSVGTNAINQVNDVNTKAVLPDPFSTAQAVSYVSGGGTNTYTKDITQQ